MSGTRGCDTPGTLVHHALIYDTDEQFLSSALPFCLEGVEREEAVLAVTTPANTALLHEALGVAAGRVEFARPDDWYRTPGLTLAAYHHYMEERSAAHPRIRILGEPVWDGRDEVENDEWTRYEAAANKAFADHRAWIVCPYDTRALSVSVVADARRTHPALMHDGSALASPNYIPPDTSPGTWEGTPEPPPPGVRTARMEFGSDLSAARGFAAAHAIEFGLSPEGVDRLVFAVNEVASNALAHGDGERFLTLWLDGGRVVCDVTDTGGTSPAWYSGYLPPTAERPGGHGMWVVRQLCDLVEIHSLGPGTLVRLRLDLGQPL
ncbi:sensor histidine kinase [Actinocorallia sp. B10E7]|uniref:sensor histidine kinase n=1 Tax=Actinocorallia sp. B10E7 TaxID=3153558 RepID=UPI00325EEE22